MARRPPTHRTPRRAGLFGRLVRWAFILVLVFGLVGPLAVVAVYRFVPPPMTFLMVERTVEGQGSTAAGFP